MKTKFSFTEKVICILLCIALIMPYIPYTVFSASDTIYVGGVELSSGQYLASGSNLPTTTKPSGGYAYWVKNSNETTLYLNNYTYSGTGKSISGITTGDPMNCVIYANVDYTIISSGINNLTNTSTTQKASVICCKDSSLNLIGNGTLNLVNESNYSGGSYLIYGGAFGTGLTVTSGTIKGNSNSYGFQNWNDINLIGGLVDISSKYSAFTISNGRITIDGSIVSSKANSNYAMGYTTFKSGTLTAQGNYNWTTGVSINSSNQYYWTTSSTAGYTCSTDTTYKYTDSGSEISNYFKITTNPTTISLYKNDGSSDLLKKYYDKGSAVTLPANTYTRENYVFENWNTKLDGTGTTYSDGASVTLSENLSLYAQWDPTIAIAPTVTTGGDIELTYGGENKDIIVTATSDNKHDLAYQWYKCDKDGNNEQKIEGATNSSYNISSSDNVGTYYYYCDVTSTLKKDTNKTASAEKKIISVKINPATMVKDTDFTIKGDETVTYTGGEHSRTIEVSDGYTVTYGTEKDNYNLSESPRFINADKYTVYYKIERPNYNDYEGEFSIDIKKAPLTITANDKTIIYGDKPSNNGVKYEGFVNEEKESVLTGEIEYTYNYNQYGDVGNYEIDLSNSNLTAKNYDITYKKGSLKVEKKEFGIEWGETTLTINGLPQSPTATATDTVNNDEITLTVDGAETIVGNYTAKVTTINGEKSSNYKLPSNVSTEYIIQKDTPDIGTVGYSSTVLDITSPEDVVLTRTDTSVDGILEITDNEMLANKTIYNWRFTPTDTSYYNIITGTVEIDVIDTVAPNISIKIDNNIWKEFINNITLGSFYKESQTVIIEAADNENGSGIKEVLYYISNTELGIEELENVTWEKYINPFNISPNNKYIIYTKTFDNDGNVSNIVNSNGMVLYGESTVVNDNIEHIYGQKTDKAITIKLNDNTIKNIKNGETTLVENTDYTLLANGTITLKADYLDTLNVGDYTLTISYNPMGEETEQVNITNTIKISVIKANATYTAPTANDLIYNGKAQELITAGTANGGTMMYSLSKDGEYSENIPVSTKAGVYRVYYYVEGDSNHNSSKVEFITVTIEGNMEEDTTEMPTTGDNIAIYMATFIVSILGICAIIINKKQNTKD